MRTSEPEQVGELAKKLGVAIAAEIKLAGGDTLLTLNKGSSTPAVSALAIQIPGAKISPNYTYKAFLTPNDTNFSEQWNLPKIKAPEAWDITTGSSDVTVAVIDTGVLFDQEWGTHDYEQPDFPDSKKWVNSAEDPDNGVDDDDNGFIDDWQGWDFMGGFRGPDADCPNMNDPDTYEDPEDSNFLVEDNDPQPYSCDSPFEETELNKTHFDGTCDTWFSACFVGHGTSVASIAAAASNNNQLIAGMDHSAKIMNLRVLDGYGFSDSARITAAVEYAAEMGADVINMSLGLFSSLDDCSGTDAGLEAAMANAKSAGTVIVAASGNTGTSGVCFPAKSSHAIAVGATTTIDARASFSSYGPELDVVAPGQSLPVANAPSSEDNSNLTTISGTSFSSPHVAGLAGLIKSLLPSASPTTIRNLITQRADKVSGMGGNSFTTRYGHGRINAQSTVQFANLTHPDGTLIKESGQAAVYLIENSQRRRIPSGLVFNSYRFIKPWVKTATAADMTLPGATSLPLREGTIVRGSGSAIYAVNYDGATVEKRHIASKLVFNSLGYASSDILAVPDSLLPSTNGDLISNLTHPDGTLIKESGQAAVYIIEAGQRRKIPNGYVLSSYRFPKSWIKTATSPDMALPAGTSLPFREGTLVRGSGSAIYAVNYDGATVEKRHIASKLVFNSLGYASSDILEVSNGALPLGNGDSID